MSKVVLQGYIVVPDSDLSAVADELKVHIELTRQEEGCLIFEVNKNDSEENKFHVYEEFTDESAFTSHQERVRNSKWGSVTKNVERFYEILELSE